MAALDYLAQRHYFSDGVLYLDARYISLSIYIYIRWIYIYECIHVDVDM